MRCRCIHTLCEHRKLQDQRQLHRQLDILILTVSGVEWAPSHELGAGVHAWEATVGLAHCELFQEYARFFLKAYVQADSWR